MDNIIKNNKNYLKFNATFIISLSMVAAIVFVSFSLPQKVYAEDYKLNIIITNQEEVNTKADLTIKTDDDTQETTVKLNDDPEKIKERISGEPGDKVKACIEESNDNFEDCQTKKLPKDEDSTIKFKLEYEE